MALPVIPFAKLPRKNWEENAEKKERIEIIDPPSPEESSSEEESVSSSSSSEYDLIQHLSDLLPGELENGEKPKKQANMAHLEDLRVKRKPPDRLKYIKYFYGYIKQMRARERERRKHHILKEYEAKIKAYDEMLKKQVQDELEAKEKEVKLEAYRRLKRIERNSRKKVEKKFLADQFSSDIHIREKEAKQMQYYCENFPRWAIEGMNWHDQNKEEMRREKEEMELKRQKELERQLREQRIEDDRLLLEDDKRLTAEIESMMLKYGMIKYRGQTHFSEEETISNIFDRSKKLRSRKGKSKKRVSMSREIDSKEELMTVPGEMMGISRQISSLTGTSSFDADDDEAAVNRLVLRLDERNVDLDELYRDLKKNKHRRGKGNKYRNPFVDKEQFFDTGDVTKVKGYKIKELGAMSFAVELSTGLCPLLEDVCLKDCEMRDEGFARVLQGIKSANLYTLRVLDVRGNFLSAKALNYIYEVSFSGVLSNLEVLNLANNEMGDEGIDGLVRLLLVKTLNNIKEIHLQRNRITDHGFQKIAKVMMAVHNEYSPKLCRLGLENNVISSFVKQEMAPIPYYFSL